MNTLLIVRHGEAQDFLPDQPDFNRHLTQHGRERLRATAQTLIDELCMPTQIIASAAVRTRETAEIFGRMFGLNSSQISFQS
ncbi:MAG: SixA phosphatase family protein, partial [Candidatus Kapaibacterium sp.]